MPITICVQRTAIDRAEARMNEQPLASFEPAALLVDQPLFSQRPVPADPQAYGQRLFAALGGDTFRAALARLPRAPQMDSLIAIQTADAELASIPWEYLHDGTDFLIFNYLFAREAPDAPLPAPPAPELPWRLVVMGSDPLVQEVRDPNTGLFVGYAPMQRLKVVQELDLLRDDLLRQNPPAPISWQRIAPTRQALIDDLDPREPILFHYTGHGDVENGVPVLCFDDGTGCMDPRPVADLAADLRGLVYLAFLNACRTADSREPGANLALALVQHGIPAVLGTQYQVLDEAAAHFARTFYRFLASGQHPAQALYRARLQLKNQFRSEPREWAIPVLYLAQNYAWQVQRPALNEPLRPLEPPVPHTTQLRAPDQSAGRFVGRNKELLDLARLFINEQRRIVTIRGTGGMGKTALVNALAERLRFHFRDGIVAVSLFLPGENVPLRAATVRRSLADVLGIQHPAFDLPDAADTQELVLSEALRARPRLLLIWDNYETVLWRLGREASDPSSAPFDEAQRAEAAAVQRLVRLLADKGVHLLFTTRQSPVGLAGETFYPPAEQGHQLGGLAPRDSVSLLRERVGQRIPSTAFLEQLAAAVGHSPLAMGLAAARWAKSQDDEATFITNLRDELSKASDPSAQMYQQSSVEINVRLSLNALPADLRADLLALTIIANPVIIPRHGAVIWGLEDETQWFDDQAHARLELLNQASLLQGQGYDEPRNRAHAYSLQPVIASVLVRLAQEIDLSGVRVRYAAWSDHLVSRAYNPEGGIDADPAVAAQTQFLLADIAAAVPYLPPERRGWAAWRASSIFERLGQPEQAHQSITLAETTARETENQELLSRVYHQQATLLVTRGDIDGAMRLYEQSLASDESLGDVRGKSATLHAMAGVLVTRGDLDGAMRLYEQSLASDESLGNVRGKSATLANMSVVQFRQGDHETALRNARESLHLLQAMGAAPDAANVAQIIQQMEAALAGGATPQPAAFTPARLVGALTGAVVRVRRGQLAGAGVRADLERLAAEATLAPVATALLAALDGAADATATLLIAAEPLLAQGAAAERADALVGIGNLANLLNDNVTELRAREASIAAFREAGDDRQNLVNLSIALYNLAIFHAGQENDAAAVPLLEEVVALDERTGHPDLASDRAKLEEMRRRASGMPEVTLVDVVAQWRDSGGDDEQFVALLNLVCNLYVQTMRDGSEAQRDQLAADLAHLRAIRPLPVAGANDFLGVLQLRLRDEPGMAERAARIQAALPAQLAQALVSMEQQLSGEPVAPPADAGAQEAAAAMAAMLSSLPPEQRAELQVLAQVAPLLQQGVRLLQQPGITAAERGRLADGLEQAAGQAEAGETAGSPWLAAAVALRRVAGWLKGSPPEPDTLNEPYRSLMMQMLEGAGDE
ncbi:MAG: CHAT domain-containing protein [Chloroflexi bacterium]|nr:CHAT domain-containing protein [Chloroflexota bacterium]